MLLTRLALGVALVSASTAALAELETYEIDASHAEVVFRINHLGFSYTFGKFNAVSGEVQFDADNPEAGSVTVHIDPASINFGHQGKEDHLRNEDFFHVDEYPEATFQSTGIKKTGENTFEVTGELTLHGATVPVTLDTTLNKHGKHPFRDKTGVGFSATTTISRSDWGVSHMVPMVGDDVQLWIELEAWR